MCRMATLRTAPARRNRGCCCSSRQRQRIEGHQTHGLLLSPLTTNSLFLQEIEAFQQAANELGREIQSFVVDISRFESLACIPQDLTEFKLDRDQVEILRRRRRRLLHKLSSYESCGVDLRKRLREVDSGILSNISTEEVEDANGNTDCKTEAVSSLDLPVDRSTQIIFVEQYIIQLTETRTKLRKLWHRFTRGIKNLETLDNFECRYKKVRVCNAFLSINLAFFPQYTLCFCAVKAVVVVCFKFNADF